MGPQERAELPEAPAWSLQATFPLFLDAKNYVWRDNGDGTSSMARTNPDNSPIPEPRTYLIPAPSRDAAEAWHSLAALSEEVERYRGVLECGHAKQFGAVRPGGWTCRVCQLHEAEAQRDELVKVARAARDQVAAMDRTIHRKGWSAEPRRLAAELASLSPATAAFLEGE